MNLKKTLLASVLLAGFAGGEARADRAPDVTVTLDHNGSGMEAQLLGEAVRIFYVRPRAGLTEAGVRAGTGPGDELVFLKRNGDGTWSGTAKSYKKNCPAATYSVTGTVAGAVLKLDAPEAPSWNKGAQAESYPCGWRLSAESKHRHLEFTADTDAELARLDPASDEAKKARFDNSLEGAWARQDAERQALVAEREKAEAEARRQAEAERERVEAERQKAELLAMIERLRAEQAAMKAAVDAAQAVPVATPAPVAETVARDAAPPPVTPAATVTEAPIAAVDTAPAPAVEPAPAAPAPAPVQAAPEPAKPKLDIDL